jgi:hypothetical protein
MDAPPAMNWWDEVRARIRHTAQNIPSGIEQQTMLNLLADPEALELVFEPYVDLEPRFAVYQAMSALFFWLTRVCSTFIDQRTVPVSD